MNSYTVDSMGRMLTNSTLLTQTPYYSIVPQDHLAQSSWPVHPLPTSVCVTCGTRNALLSFMPVRGYREPIMAHNILSACSCNADHRRHHLDGMKSHREALSGRGIVNPICVVCRDYEMDAPSSSQHEYWTQGLSLSRAASVHKVVKLLYPGYISTAVFLRFPKGINTSLLHRFRVSEYF